MIYLIILFILLPAGYAAPQRVRFGGRVPRRGAGAEPLHQSTTKLLLTPERGERGGAAAAPAGRRLPQEARAARSLGKAKVCFEPRFEDVEKSKGYYSIMIYYILQFIFILTVINTFSTPFTQDLTHNPNNRGFGGRVPRRGAGAEPLHQYITYPPFNHRARRAGRRSRRARRAQASAGSASRAELGKDKSLLLMHAM